MHSIATYLNSSTFVHNSINNNNNNNNNNNINNNINNSIYVDYINYICLLFYLYV